jgi:hypothetical protein
MTSASFLIVATLLTILVGAALPVLYQLYRTLKQTRALLDSAGPHFERTLDQVGSTAERFDWIGERLEGPAQALGPLFEMAAKGGHSIGHSEEWPRMPAPPGGARAPAIIAGVSALLSGSGVRQAKGNGGDHSLSQLTG